MGWHRAGRLRFAQQRRFTGWNQRTSPEETLALQEKAARV